MAYPSSTRTASANETTDSLSNPTVVAATAASSSIDYVEPTVSIPSETSIPTSLASVPSTLISSGTTVPSITSGITSPSTTSPNATASQVTSANATVANSTLPDATSSNSSLSNTTTSTNTISSNTTSTPTTSVPPTPSYTPDKTLIFPSVYQNPTISSKCYNKLTKMIPKILTNANLITEHSWEIGAFTETLLEVYHPALTPFEWCSESNELINWGMNEIPWNVLIIAKNSLIGYNWTDSPSHKELVSNELTDYIYKYKTPVKHIKKALINGDGSLGDPVSLIPSIWILSQFSKNIEVQSRLNQGVELKRAEDYAWAIGNQIDYLNFNHTSPENDTISQREDHFELWSDMMYMIPPSLTYLGLSLNDEDYIKQGLEQWQLESYALLDSTVYLYRHINDSDARLWATGNGWAVYGAMRNLYAVKASGLATRYSQIISETENTLLNVFTALFNELDNQSLIPNYMRFKNATLEERDGDTAGTALVVAAYYRFITLCPGRANDIILKLAEKAFDGVVAKIDENGWVTHAVDPMGTDGCKVYAKNTSMHSPEAQAFTAKMWKARTVAGY